MIKIEFGHAAFMAIKDFKEGRLTAEQALQALDLLVCNESPLPALLEADRVAERWVEQYEVAQGIPV